MELMSRSPTNFRIGITQMLAARDDLAESLRR